MNASFKRRVCPECGTGFAPTGGRQRFCADCRYVDRSCQACDGTFRVARAELARRPAAYCSAPCRLRGLSRGGLYFNPSTGRWVVVCRDGSLVLYSRAVMSCEAGRDLRRDELVHHRNGDTADDRVENLQVLTAREHLNLHRDDMRAGWRRRQEAMR